MPDEGAPAPSVKNIIQTLTGIHGKLQVLSDETKVGKIYTADDVLVYKEQLEGIDHSRLGGQIFGAILDPTDPTNSYIPAGQKLCASWFARSQELCQELLLASGQLSPHMESDFATACSLKHALQKLQDASSLANFNWSVGNPSSAEHLKKIQVRLLNLFVVTVARFRRRRHECMHMRAQLAPRERVILPDQVLDI